MSDSISNPVSDDTFRDVWLARYPLLLGHVYCGFYLPRGWEGPVWKLCELLSWNFPDVRCAQVKEKFGGLRFYVDGGCDESYALVHACEAACDSMCLACGDAGKRTSLGGWIATLCDDCKEKGMRQ